MLLSAIIANEERADLNNWIIEADDYGDKFLNKGISQRIKIVKFLKGLEVSTLYQNGNTVGYKFPDKTHLSINPKNMSIALVKTGKDDTVHSDTENICYVTIVNNDYKLIDYCLPTEYAGIVQTYKNKAPVTQGCGIMFDTKNIPEDTFVNGKFPVISMTLYDVKASKYVKVEVVSDDDLVLSINKTDITDLITINNLKDKTKDSKFYNHFKVSDTKEILSSVVIVSEKLFDNVVNVIKEMGLKNIDIIAIRNNDFAIGEDGKTSYSEDIDKFLRENIVDRKIRAITAVGVKVPRDFCLKYRILYLFAYDLKHKITRTIKSN